MLVDAERGVPALDDARVELLVHGGRERRRDDLLATRR